MKALVALLRAEPAAIGGILSAFISLATAFGFQLSGSQVGAIAGVVAAVTGFIVRSQVTPTVPPAQGAKP